MITFKQAQKYVPKPPNRSIETYENGDTQDIIETILYAEKREQEQRFMKDLAPLLKGRNDAETCKNIFDFVRKGMRYIADERGHEKVKSSRWSIYYGPTIGLDCKSYSVLINSILRESGIKYKYRFVSWETGRDVSHVYPIALLQNGSFEFPIALDAIPDSCGFNCEIRYSYKKDYEVTKISYIDGINANSSIPQQQPLNWVSLTDGEAAVSLAKDRLKLLIAAHPDSPKVGTWKKTINWIDNALYRGLHSGAVALPTGIFASKEEQGIINFIKSAQKRFSPAAGDSFAFINRKNAWEGIRELGHVGDITLEDCEKLCTYKEYSAEEGIYIDKMDYECKNKCEDRNKAAQEVMNIAKRSGHHFLYEYMTDEQVLVIRPTQRYKYDNHTQVISKFSELSLVSRLNVREAFKTEIMRANSLRGIGAMTPEDSINELIKNYDLSLKEVTEKYPDKIQGPIIIIPAVVWIILASAAAAIGVLMAVTGLIQVLRDKEPTAFDKLTGFTKAITNATGGNVWSPEGIDFKNTANVNCPDGWTKDSNGQCIPPTTTKSGGLPAWAIPAAAGGLLLGGFLLSDNKK